MTGENAISYKVSFGTGGGWWKDKKGCTTVH